MFRTEVPVFLLFPFPVRLLQQFSQITTRYSLWIENLVVMADLQTDCRFSHERPLPEPEVPHQGRGAPPCEEGCASSNVMLHICKVLCQAKNPMTKDVTPTTITALMSHKREAVEFSFMFVNICL